MIASTASTATLRRAVFPRAGILTDALLILGGALFVAVFAQISIPLPFTPVPITGQTFAVLLVGGALGTVCGTLSMGLYMFLGIIGLPVYADHTHGWHVVTGATGGYIVGFLVAAALVGLSRRPRLGQALRDLGHDDADRQRVHLPVRMPVAPARAAHQPREDARVRALPVRAGGDPQALPRCGAAAGRLGARAPAAQLAPPRRSPACPRPPIC